jgi:hypothetical protein
MSVKLFLNQELIATSLSNLNKILKWTDVQQNISSIKLCLNFRLNIIWNNILFDVRKIMSNMQGCYTQILLIFWRIIQLIWFFGPSDLLWLNGTKILLPLRQQMQLTTEKPSDCFNISETNWIVQSGKDSKHCVPTRKIPDPSTMWPFQTGKQSNLSHRSKWNIQIYIV